jgi:hypothetical protein
VIYLHTFIKMKTLKIVFNSTIAIIFVISLNSCRKKSELKQYESVLSSFKYKLYKGVSETVIPPLLFTYNLDNRNKDSLVVSEEIIRLLLGYYWAVTGNTTFAFAEGNITKDFSKDANYVSLSHMLIAVGMYEKGWKNIAKGESNKGIDILNKTPNGKYTKIELMGFHFIIGTLCIYEKNFDAARFHFAGFALLTGFDWTYTLVDAMGDINQGNTQTGLQKIKKLSDDPSVPEEIRTTLKKTISEVEKITGNVDSALFWPSVVSEVIYKQLKDVSKNGIGVFFNLIDRIKKKINF